MSKYLLRGFGLVGLSSSIMFYREGNQLPSLEEEVINNFVDGEEEQDELIKKAGLECGKNYCWPNSKENRKFNVEKNKKDENLFFDSWTKGRLRVHRGSEGYPSGLRFTIEGSDISLYSRKFWISNLTSSLEEFENYEIKKEGGKYYLSRTKNSREGMIVELGLPDSCVLPEEGESTCSIFHVEKVKFGEGMVGEVDSEVSLTITKTEDTSFRDGFKFTFTFPQDVTIGGKEVKAKSPVDFRMKKHKDGHLTLEWAWVDEKELLDKVGLICEEDNVCSIKTGGTLKIKKGEKQDFLDFSDLVGGRIKLYRNDEEYSNGLRLEVGGGNIGSGADTLEEFETYEIKEGENEYYLLLKKNSEERISELLKYPCSLSTECNIFNERKLKAIKFEGKDVDSISLQQGQTVKITVSKTTEENYPVGWKFTITSTGDLNISDSNSVKANAPTDFKLKKHEDGSLTLERAWAKENDLAGKVGLVCGEDEDCTISSGGLEVRKENRDFKISELSGGKIKIQKDTKGYSNGFKFEIKEGKIGSGDDVLEEFETYEIKNVDGKYYLVLKTKAEERIRELLKFPTECYVSSECSISSEDKFKAINFENKNVGSISLPQGKTVKITVSNAPEGDFPFSRKFTVTSTGDLSISSSTDVKANSPTDFKLKKHDNGDLFLEKAWTDEKKLVGKVGLSCSEADNNCTINGNLKVRKDGKDLQFSNLPGGKIKLYKNSSGYSNGLKFEIEDGNIVSEGNTLEEFETYEISEDRSGYYLGLKTSADEKIKKLLNYPSRCSLSSCDNLNENEFKKINFSGKNESSISIAKDKKVKITVSKTSEDDYPLGRKFSVTSTVDLNISSFSSLKANVPTEFKIKRGEETGQRENLSLEKAWNLTALTKKVGLSCSNGDICTITQGGLNVKKDGNLLKGLSRSESPGSGKIKLMREQAGYNEGFKFQIQDENIDLSSSGAQNVILETFESYEIKKVGDDYYLDRKTDALQGKWKALGLPSQCLSKYNVNAGCSISFNDLGKIKFYGKNPNKSITTGSANYWLKTFKKTNESDFPLGIEVKMEVKRGNVKIPKTTGGTIILWNEYETEFKVKKEGDDYYLVRTVDVNEEVKKFGITNGNCDDEKGCTVGSKINIYMGGQKYWNGATVKDTNTKITYRWGDMIDKGFTNNLVFRVPDKGIGLTSYTSGLTRSMGQFNSIEKGNYVIKTSSVGSDNNRGTVTYLYKEEALKNYDPNDNFFS